jgi:hypothetical protein
VWVGKINLQAGSLLLAVEYDDPSTAAVIQQRCGAWLSDDEREIPAAFGLRTVKVGFLRRIVALIHHGAPIRARLDNLGAAVDVLVTFLAEIEQLEKLIRSRSGQVAVDARAFVRNGEVVLLHAPLSLDLDNRRVSKLGIEEIHTWRPLVDPADGSVTIGTRPWPLRAIVIAGHNELDLDDARRHAWSLATPSEVAWAELIDTLGDRVGTTALDVPEALDQALG